MIIFTLCCTNRRIVRSDIFSLHSLVGDRQMILISECRQLANTCDVVVTRQLKTNWSVHSIRWNLQYNIHWFVRYFSIQWQQYFGVQHRPVHSRSLHMPTWFAQNICLCTVNMTEQHFFLSFCEYVLSVLERMLQLSPNDLCDDCTACGKFRSQRVKEAVNCEWVQTVVAVMELKVKKQYQTCFTLAILFFQLIASHFSLPALAQEEQTIFINEIHYGMLFSFHYHANAEGSAIPKCFWNEENLGDSFKECRIVILLFSLYFQSNCRVK